MSVPLVCSAIAHPPRLTQIASNCDLVAVTGSQLDILLRVQGVEI